MRIRWNGKAFEQIRRLPETKAELRRHANAIAQRCGKGYVAVSGEGRTRSRAAVLAVSHTAREDNAKNNTLVREIGRHAG